MSKKFTRNVIRAFMEQEMKTQLFERASFCHWHICTLYTEFADEKNKARKGLEFLHYPLIESILDKIEFINALKEYCGSNVKTVIDEEDTTRRLFFTLDPCDVLKWENIMNDIYEPSKDYTTPSIDLNDNKKTFIKLYRNKYPLYIFGPINLSERASVAIRETNVSFIMHAQEMYNMLNNISLLGNKLTSQRIQELRQLLIRIEEEMEAQS